MRLPNRIAGNLALDFANTVDWRSTARETDHLASAKGLAAWARATDLVDDAEPAQSAVVAMRLRDAHALRDAIGAIGSAFARRAAPPAPALQAVRDVAASALSRAGLAGDPLRPVFREDDRILGAVAWAAFELFTGPETARIKECPFHDCRWLFVDRSKNGSRRWCEMATCGNRAKKQAMSRGGAS